ncbi:hypothetical protein [Enhygromyxa salina]|uniref:Uncharacterized protein n=1 Tax=Enhygromyxa salina TaxID=215803 RepID=A0A2S9Y7P2_9BACT|nr:hypothetical protein [Enhygromyxa salina]PRQ01115.1 hypothetical protein ENSA7_57200 [Enhygromyxa salina]
MRVQLLGVLTVALATSSTALAAPSEPTVEQDSPSAEPAEPAEFADDVSEPALVPVQQPAPPPEQPRLPSYDAELPTYADTPLDPFEPVESLEPVLPHRPLPDGRGRVAVGAILSGGGLVLTGVSIGMIAIDEDIAVWIPGAVIGGAAIIAGLSAALVGRQRRDKYREWTTPHGGPDVVPKSGIGLVASGVTCMVAGTVGVIAGGISLPIQGNGDMPYGQVLLPVSAASIVTGAGLLGGGLKRHRKFETWNAQRSLTPVVAPLGGLGRQPSGASFGVAGRF